MFCAFRHCAAAARNGKVTIRVFKRWHSKRPGLCSSRYDQITVVEIHVAVVEILKLSIVNLRLISVLLMFTASGIVQ